MTPQQLEKCNRLYALGLRYERCNRLYALGLRYNGAEYVKGDLNVHWTEITCDSDEVFQRKLQEIEAVIAARDITS